MIKRQKRGFTLRKKDITKISKSSTFKEIFSYNLVKHMREKDMTSLELAKALKVSDPLINLWRSGTLPGSLGFKKLCSVFGINAQDFFSVEDK